MRRTKKTAKPKPLPRSASRNRRPLPAPVHTKPTKTPKTLAIGDRVAHLQFGDGIVTDIEDHKLTIDFDAVGRKHIIDSYVKQKQ